MIASNRQLQNHDGFQFHHRLNHRKEWRAIHHNGDGRACQEDSFYQACVAEREVAHHQYGCTCTSALRSPLRFLLIMSSSSSIPYRTGISEYVIKTFFR
jgi:hypothetical protein